VCGFYLSKNNLKTLDTPRWYVAFQGFTHHITFYQPGYRQLM
jgi:hypothetical protein